MRPASCQTQQPYQWGDGGSGWRLVDQDNLSVIEETLLPGTAEVMHFHAAAEQCFYMLEGCAVMHVETTPVTLTCGMALHIPAGTSHAISNNSDQTIRFLVISTPSTRNDRHEMAGK